MESVIKVNRRLVIALLTANVLYLLFNLYQEVSITWDWVAVILQVLLIGVSYNGFLV